MPPQPTPIWAFAAATPRSAAAMSGLRSRSSDGTPMGTSGGVTTSGSAGSENEDAATTGIRGLLGFEVAVVVCSDRGFVCPKSQYPLEPTTANSRNQAQRQRVLRAFCSGGSCFSRKSMVVDSGPIGVSRFLLIALCSHTLTDESEF